MLCCQGDDDYTLYQSNARQTGWGEFNKLPRFKAEQRCAQILSEFDDNSCKDSLQESYANSQGFGATAASV